MSLRSSGLQPDMRHRPVCCPAPGPAGRPCSFFPEGACGTTGRFTAPAAPCAGAHGSVCPKSTRQTQPRKQLNARVPHANGLCGLLHAPGVVACADAPPFVRAVARTCTWTVRPSRRRLSPVRRRGSAILEARFRVRHRSGHRIPLPRIEDDRDAPLTGAGWLDDSSPDGEAKSTHQERTSTSYCFLKIRKTCPQDQGVIGSSRIPAVMPAKRGTRYTASLRSPMAKQSSRAKRANKGAEFAACSAPFVWRALRRALDCFVATLLAMTASLRSPSLPPPP